MDTSWVFNMFEAAWQDTEDDGLINYHVADNRSYIGYIQIFVKGPKHVRHQHVEKICMQHQTLRLDYQD